MFNSPIIKLLNITVVAEVELTGPSNMIIGDTGAEFKCLVDSNPVATIKWYRGSTEVNSFPKHTIVDNNTLVRQEETYKIQTIKVEDMDVYKCEATNVVTGETKTSFKEINVKCKTVFISIFILILHTD